jgi:hypothetical protein
MAPPSPLFVLQEKKEDDSTSKYTTDELQYNAPPSHHEVKMLNKQFKT